MDLATSAPKEHMNADPGSRARMGRTLGLVALALLLAAFMGWSNFHTDETGFLAGLMFIGVFALSVMRPRWAWLWALVLGASVPGGAILCRWLGVQVRFPNEWADIRESCLAFIPAAVGAIAGAGLRWGIGLVLPRGNAHSIEKEPAPRRGLLMRILIEARVLRSSHGQAARQSSSPRRGAGL